MFGHSALVLVFSYSLQRTIMAWCRDKQVHALIHYMPISTSKIFNFVVLLSEQAEGDLAADDDGTLRMANFLRRMQPGRGPTEQLTMELAALGSLVKTIHDLLKKIHKLEVRLLKTELHLL